MGSGQAERGEGVLDRETESKGVGEEGACPEAPGVWQVSPNYPGGPHPVVEPRCLAPRDELRDQIRSNSDGTW